jgi:uracil-DNA glycosylase
MRVRIAGSVAGTDRRQYLVISSPHPSAFSVHKGFFGSKPFSKANIYLVAQDKIPIQWA